MRYLVVIEVHDMVTALIGDQLLTDVLRFPLADRGIALISVEPQPPDAAPDDDELYPRERPE